MAEENFAASPPSVEGGPDILGMSTEPNIFESIERPAFIAAQDGVASVEDARKRRPANFSIKASADGVEVVEIFDMIGGWGVWASEMIPALRRIDGEGKKVEIRVNSPGGDVFEGVSIANAIRFMKADTTVVVYGLAASAASVIAVSADELKMPANSMLMIHRPRMVAVGESQDLRSGADLLDKIEVQLVDTYAAKAKAADRDTLAEMVSAETWLTAEEAVAIGLADIVMDDVKMAACAVREIAAHGDVPAEAVELLAGPTDKSETPAASIEQEQAPAVEATEEPAPVEEPGLSDEAVAEIRTACAVFDLADKADEFIAARASFEDVRAALWNARAEKSAATEIDTRVAPVAEDPKARKSRAPGEPTALQAAYAARMGRKL